MIPINVETRLHRFYFNYTIEDDLYEELSNELMARIEDIWKMDKMKRLQKVTRN